MNGNIIKVSLDDIITGQTINFPSMSTNYLIPVLQKLPYIIYKAKLSEFSNNYKNIDVYSYHVNKLSDIGTYNSLPLNDVPKYIYLNTKYNISDIKKSISLNRKELNNVQYKKEIMSYRKKRNHIFIKGVATYVNTCNFQIFVQFLVNLILFNALFNICQLSYFISVFIFIKFIYSNKNSKYRCNDIHKVAKAMVNHYDILKLIQNYQFDFWSNFGHIIIYMFSHKYTAYYAKIIVDNYIFKLTPLVIAVMSGMFAMYSNDDTSGIFEILIQYTIPVLSSIQFFRLMMKFYRNK